MTRILVLCALCCSLAAADFKGFGMTLPGGPHRGMDQELKVVYWEGREIPAGLKRDDTEMRNYFHWYAPKGAKGPLPGIILIHGGGFGQGSPDGYAGKNNQAAQWLTSHGYVVFALGYTLRTGNGRLVASDETRQAIRFIKANAERFRVDPERLGAWGFSAGSMILTKLLTIPDGGDFKHTYKDKAGKKASKMLPADTGPLAESGTASTLRVMICSSCHEIHPKNAAKDLGNEKVALPKAVLIYQAPGEKPWVTGRVPPDDPIRKAYEARKVVFDGYGVPKGKHCPSLALEVERDGEKLPMRDVVFQFLEKQLKGSE